jgi:hypothetical protein
MVLSADLITGLLSFVITLLILSYLIGDNPLFRLTIYVFTGVSAGYIAVVAFWQVLWPKLLHPLIYGARPDQILVALPMIGAVLILMKVSPRLTKLGSPAMAYLVGAGAAVAIGGALTGTLFPQMAATIDAFDLQAAATRDIGYIEVMFNGGVILVGTVTSLAYFHFGARTASDGSARRNFLVEGFAWVGRIFIAITLGVIFAGVYAAALAAFIERISSLINFIGSF